MSVYRTSDGELAAEVTNAKFCDDLNKRANNEIMKEITDIFVKRRMSNIDVIANLSYILADVISSGHTQGDSICILGQDVGEYIHVTAHLIHESNKSPQKKDS